MEKNRKKPPRPQRGAITRAAAILLVAIAGMLVLLAVPAWRAYQYRAQDLACEQAMKSARDGLIIEYLSHWETGSVQEAMATLDEVMPERANLCPAGGNVYLVRDENGIFQPICGLHADDHALRTRLNASRARELLEQALQEDSRRGERAAALQNETAKSTADPEGTSEQTKSADIEIPMNGALLLCRRVLAEEPLRRGTGTTQGYQGTVAFYGVSREGAFDQENRKAGTLCYFVYADEEYCAVWRAKDGWSGSAYA